MRITRKEIRGLIMEELHRALSEAAFPEDLEGVYGEEPPEAFGDEPTDYDEAYNTFGADAFLEIRAAAERFFDKFVDGVPEYKRRMSFTGYIQKRQPDLYDSLIAAVGGDAEQLDYLLNAAYEGMLPEIQFDTGAQEDYEEEVRSSRY